MKKCFGAIASIVIAFGFFSCKENNVNGNGGVELRQVQFDDEKDDLKEEMIFYSLTENYKLSDEAVYNDLTSFIALQKTDNVKNEKDYARAVETVKKDYDIKKVKTIRKSLPVYDYSQRSVDSTDEVNISVYDISNEAEGTNGVAVTSDDERIGSLLCVLDDVDVTDSEDDPVLDIFMTKLDGYVENISTELESITENDIEEFKVKYNITDEEIENARIEYENSEDSRQFWGWGDYSSWSICSANYNNFAAKVTWGQHSPYNNAIYAMEGNNYLTGCGPTAVAQIMAYHEWPESYGRSDLDTLKSKWNLASDWDGVYNWEKMTEYKTANLLSSEGKIGVAALMYEVSKGCNADYGTYDKGGTGTYPGDLINYFRTRGYTCDDADWYSYDSIVNSLNTDCPVIVFGDTGTDENAKGHAWIIDGSIKAVRYRNYYVFWIPFRNTEYGEYVHCNYGWSGTDNEGSAYSLHGAGYYKSAVFSTSVGDYSTNLGICTNIRPVKN